MRFFLVLFALLASPATAQVELGAHDAFQTRFGLLEVRNISEFEEMLHLDGTPLPAVQGRFVQINGAWALGEESTDWVLVTTMHGGNMCPGVFQILRVGGGTAQISDAIGECEGGALDVRVTPGRIELDVAHPDLAVARVTYGFDGTTLATTRVAAVMGGGDPAMSDPRQWIGTHPSVALRDPAEQARFLQVMTEDDLRALSGVLGPATNVEERAGWIIGTGCQAHACNFAAGVWGVRLSDGAAAAGLLEQNRVPTLFGAASDPVFAGIVAERQAALR